MQRCPPFIEVMHAYLNLLQGLLQFKRERASLFGQVKVFDRKAAQNVGQPSAVVRVVVR